MKRREDKLAGVIPVLVAAAAVAAIAVWLHGRESPRDLALRVPVEYELPEATAETEPALPGALETFDASAADLPGRWDQFRGTGRDGIADTDAPLAVAWPDDGPATLWTLGVGEGYAAPIVVDGRVYLLDYDMDAQADALRCLSLADGAEIWRRSYPIRILRSHGMSRTAPAYADGRVVTLGPKGHVMCVDAVTGEYHWGIDLVGEYGTKIPPWYAGQCPLIDDGKVILAPAGPDALMVAVDLASGEVLWTAPNPHGWKMSHASIMPIKLAGRRTYVYPAAGGVAGVSTDGELLWATDAWKISIATVPSAVGLGDDRVFLTGGYNAGSMVMEVRSEDGETTAGEVYRIAADTFACEQQTPILYEGRLYGVRMDGQFACLDPAAGGVLWTSGTDRRFGLGGYILAGGMFYVLDDEGALTLIDASQTEYRELARADVLDGHEAWGPPALAATRLLVRDLTTLKCLDVGAGGSP